MRISYLLDAYRRLDKAAGRALGAETAQDIEAAISDIMLLGSPSQVRLADEFGRTFADKGDVEAKPLMMDLRASLRRELRLEPMPPAYLALRITPNGEAAENSARIWREAVHGAWQSVTSEFGADAGPASTGQASDAAGAMSPSAVVAVSAHTIEVALRDLLGSNTPDDLSSLNLAQLANRALELKLIDAKLADSLNGFSVMRLLAAMDQDRLDDTKANEFSNLATALLYLLRRL